MHRQRRRHPRRPAECLIPAAVIAAIFLIGILMSAALTSRGAVQTSAAPDRQLEWLADQLVNSAAPTLR